MSTVIVIWIPDEGHSDLCETELKVVLNSISMMAKHMDYFVKSRLLFFLERISIPLYSLILIELFIS